MWNHILSLRTTKAGITSVSYSAELFGILTKEVTYGRQLHAYLFLPRVTKIIDRTGLITKNMLATQLPDCKQSWNLNTVPNTHEVGQNQATLVPMNSCLSMKLFMKENRLMVLHHSLT